MRLVRECFFETGERLVHRLPAQFERPVMDRQDESRFRFVAHRDGFLGRAVRANPRVVGADRRDDQINRAARRERAGVGARGVAHEAEPPAAALDEVGVVGAVLVALHPRAPVPQLERRKRERSAWRFDLRRFTPAQFDDFTKPDAPENIRSVPGGDNGGVAVDVPERPCVEMVEMRVRQKHEVDARQFARFQRARDVAFWAERERADVDAASREEDGIGEDRDAEEIDEHGRLSQPRGGDPVVAPRPWLRVMWRRRDGAADVAEDRAEHRQPSGKRGRRTGSYGHGARGGDLATDEHG